MKKVLLIIGLAVAAMTVNAQLFVGGGINFSTNVNKDADGDKTNQKTSFGFTPEIGYSLNDKLDAGLDLTIGLTKTTVWATSNTSTDTKTTNWEIAPFAQYSCVEFGNFKLIGKASLYIGGDKGAAPMLGDDKYKTTSYGLRVAPSLHYSVSDNITIFGNLNFLQLGLGGTTAKYDGDKTGSNFKANFGVNTFNVANTGNIQIGAVYKF